MTTLTNPESWTDLCSLINTAHFEEVDNQKYLVLSWEDEQDYTATTRTLLRRILREINRKIMRIYSLIEYDTCKLILESVYTNITYEEYEVARKLYNESLDYEEDSEWGRHRCSCINHAHNNSSPSDDSDSSDDDNPSPQQSL